MNDVMICKELAVAYSQGATTAFAWTLEGFCNHGDELSCCIITLLDSANNFGWLM
jgi:hypothetical protein